MNSKETIDYLVQHGIKPSVQRMAVMEYLLSHHTHPTADEIHSALTARIPTLSKTTVYNTLRLLVDNGAVTQLTIDERNVCFDAEARPHAHFLCNRCGKVYDLPLRQVNIDAAAEIPESFRTESAALYYCGKCAACTRAESHRQ